MRIDLLFFGGVEHLVSAKEAQALFLLFQRTSISPKVLKRVKKTGGIRFFLSEKEAARFAASAASEALDFTAKRRGIPAFWKGFVREPGLVVGVILSVLLLLAARAVLWDVRITGNERIASSELEALLAESGLVEGTLLFSLDADEIELALRQADERVAYAAVNISGTVAHVQIREADLPSAPKTKSPANLVAKYDGVVTMPLIFEGECLVSPGEVVRAGQILAGGLSDTQNHGYLVTRAAGQVLARTVHTFEVRVPFAYEEKEYTGEEKYEISLFFFGRAQKVFKNTGKSDMECDIIEIIKKFSLPTGEELPVGYRVITEAEYSVVSRTRTCEQARAIAQEQLQALLAADGAGRTLLEKRTEYRVDAEGITLICTVVCEEDIAAVSEFTLNP